MIILIYGHKGWIGQQIICYLNKIYTEYQFTYICGTARVDNIKEVENEIKSIYPTHIISLIGRTHGDGIQTIDYLEDHLYENVRDNLFGPIALSMLSKKYDYHLSYLGTGCIFEYDNTDDILNGNKDYKKFNEADTPNFNGSSYSVVKGFTDELMHLTNSLNIRIRMPITSKTNERNFITKITSYEKICSIPNSMTVLDELIPIMMDLVFKKHIGTINMVNPGVISHNEILDMYKEIVDPNFTWDNFTIEEQNEILKSKRSNNHLDTTLLEELYPTVKNVHESVKECLQNFILLE
jgi:3,5-epimerase/4-reductase